MKNTYVTPEVEVISVDAANVLDASTGDIDINVEADFF